MNDNAKVFLGFIAGLCAGAVAGILLAPDRGDATRRMIADRAKTLGTDVGDQLNPSMEKIADAAKVAIESITDQANKILQKAGEKAEAASSSESKSE